MASRFSSIVLATRNAGKLREFRSLLTPTGWKVLGLGDLSIELDHEETGSSFAENARGKALAYSNETNLPVLADDSGLAVAALDGRPGVYSARMCHHVEEGYGRGRNVDSRASCSNSSRSLPVRRSGTTIRITASRSPAVLPLERPFPRSRSFCPL